MTIIELHLFWQVVTCLLFAKFCFESLQMWGWNKVKILYCEWCFNFWFSIAFACTCYLIEPNYFLGLIPFIVPPLNLYIDGIIQRH